MNIIATIKNTTLANSKRTLQALVYGKMAATATEYMPWGVDSCPVPGASALYSDTTNAAVQAISGYLNSNQKSTTGECALYATDSSGVEQVRIQLRGDGTMELGGSNNHMAQYEGLATAFNQLKQDFDNLVLVFNSHIHLVAALPNPTGATIPDLPTATAGQPSTADITVAKLDNLKTQ